jgi:RNA polymerase sigma-70 factor (ECF subfamily)
LLRSFVAGEVASLGVLASKYEEWLLGLARAIVRDEALARDAVQEMWVRVIRHARGFEGESSVKTWMYRILVNRCIDALGHARATRARESGDVELAAQRSNATTRSTPEVDTSDELLQRALARLDDQQRVLVLLHYHKGLTHDETAVVMGVPTGTIKSRLHAALTKLREALADQHDGAKEALR